MLIKLVSRLELRDLEQVDSLVLHFEALSLQIKIYVQPEFLLLDQVSHIGKVLLCPALYTPFVIVRIILLSDFVILAIYNYIKARLATNGFCDLGRDC